MSNRNGLGLALVLIVAMLLSAFLTVSGHPEASIGMLIFGGLTLFWSSI